MSAAPAKTADPSMEEILASIRRIIADDDEARPAANAPDAKEATDFAAESAPYRAIEEPVGDEPMRAAPLPEDDDEVLDLARAPDAKPASRTSLEIEVPDIQFEAVPEPKPADPVLEAPVAPAPAAASLSAPPQAQRPPVAQPQPVSEALISQAATSSVGQAFNLLSHTIMSQNAHTLEDIVREMLRPMLKTWLDDNLPPLVERLVAAEIERVARGRR